MLEYCACGGVVDSECQGSGEYPQNQKECANPSCSRLIEGATYWFDGLHYCSSRCTAAGMEMENKWLKEPACPLDKKEAATCWFCATVNKKCMYPENEQGDYCPVPLEFIQESGEPELCIVCDKPIEFGTLQTEKGPFCSNCAMDASYPGSYAAQVLGRTLGEEGSNEKEKCDSCGHEIKGDSYFMRTGGDVLKVCDTCAMYGEPEGQRLKPCPFCGFEPMVTTDEEIDGNEDKREGNYCVNCNVREGGCGATGGFSGDRDVAIAKWNRRLSERRVNK